MATAEKARRLDRIATENATTSHFGPMQSAEDVPEGMRAAALTQAAAFLGNESVQKSSDVLGKKNFLLQKGVTVEEIEEAFRRAGLEMPPPEPAAEATPAATGDPAAKQDHPYSNKFFAVLQAVQKGETLPGIKEVDDSARDDVTVTHKGDKPRPLKPWEKKKQAAGGALADSSFDRKRDEKVAGAAAVDPLGASNLRSVPKVEVAAPVSQLFAPTEPAKWDSTDLKVCACLCGAVAVHVTRVPGGCAAGLRRKRPEQARPGLRERRCEYRLYSQYTAAA